MPTIALHPLAATRSAPCINVLPQLLQTPSGLAIVEMQGTVNSTLSTTDNTANGATPVGNLVFPHYDASMPASDTSWQKRVHLYVGKHQRLTGEVKKLTKPIAIIRRRPASSAGPESDEMEIAEVVYYKLLFAHRPEPVGGGVS